MGQSIVRDIHPFTASSFTSLFTQMNGVTYFIAEDGVTAQHGMPTIINLDGNPHYELYRTDGTAEGTYLVKDIVPGSGGLSASNISELFVLNDKLYFNALGVLWVSDGTAEGTMTLMENLSAEGPGGKYFTEFKGEVYFVAREGNTGEELWKTDGTAAGTKLVKDIRFGGQNSSIEHLIVAGDRLYFIADDGTHGLELWMSDGTDAGTQMVADLNGSSPAFSSLRSDSYSLFALGSMLYFSPESTAVGRELWKTDGTAGGTVLVRDIHQPWDSNPSDFAAVGNILYFTADDGVHGRELWKSDGTTDGTVLVRDLRAGGESSFILKNSIPSIWNRNLTEYNGALYFVASNGEPGADLGTSGPELWKTDGTASGTVLVKDIDLGPRGSYPDELTIVNGKLYFSASGPNGVKLWESDGTEAGTKEVPGAIPANGGHYPINITAAGGTLYFSAATFETGHELWKYSVVPTVTDVVDVSPKSRTTPVDRVVVVLSEPIDLATFTYADLHLTRNGQPVALDGSVTVTAVSGLRYRIEGLAPFTALAGGYKLQVSAEQLQNEAGERGIGNANVTWLNTVEPVTVTSVSLEGQTVVASGVISNPPEAPFAVVLDWGDGHIESLAMAAGATWFRAEHAYADNPSAGAGASFNVTARLDYHTSGARLDLLRQFGGTAPDRFNDVFIDEEGNTFATGDSGRFLSKLDPAGNLLWATQLGGTGTASAFAIEQDASGHMLVTGSFEGTVDFDPGPSALNLSSAVFSSDIFVAKYDADGNLIWAKRISGGQSFRSHLGADLTTDSAGNVYVTGYFESATLDFDPGAGVYQLSSAGGRDGFVLKLDSLGSFEWARRFGGIGDDRGHSIAVDASGDVYVGGGFTGTADFSLGGSAYSLTSSGMTDAFLFKLASSGNLAWAHRMGNSRNDEVRSLIAGPDNTLIAGGVFSGVVDFDLADAVSTLSGSIVPNVFIAHYSTDGGLVQLRGFTGRDSGFSHVQSLKADAAGNLLVLGSFSGTFDFDPGNETAYVTGDGTFLAKLDVGGNYEWVRAFGEGSLPTGLGIREDGVVVVGSFQNTVDFNPERAKTNLTSAGSYDIFYAHFVESQPLADRPALVSNVAPLVHVSAAVSLVRGQALAIGGHFDDPSTVDTFTGTVNYGDGTGDQPLTLTAFRSFNLVHEYAAAGAYSVVVTVVDDDGGIGQRTIQVSVGPRIIALSAVDPDPRRTPLESLEVTFSEPIDLATFTVADISLRRNLQPVALDSRVTVLHLSGNTYRISGLPAFTAAEGDYRVSVAGANILTLDGVTVLDSMAVEWRMDTTSPIVNALEGIAPGYRNTSVSIAELSFSEQVDLASLTFADLSLTRDGVAIPLTSAVTVTHLVGNRYQIHGLIAFTSLEGHYQLTVNGSGVVDSAGNPGAGSISAAWTMDTTPPVIVGFLDILPNPRNTPVSSVDVEFSEPLDLNTFNYLDLSLTRSGAAVSLSSDVTVEHLGGVTYRINGLAPFTLTDGEYQLAVHGSELHDAAGNSSTGSLGVSWTTDTLAPAVLDVVDVNPALRNSPVLSADVVFSEPIDLATFTFSDLVLVRGGQTVALSSAVTIAHVSGNTYRISGLAGFTAAEGNYELAVIGSGVADQAGNSGAGTSSTQWTVDATAPVLVDLVDIAPDPRSTSVSTADVVLNSAINLATFTFSDLILTRDGTPVPLTSAVTLAHLSGNTYRISGLATFTATAGAYMLTVDGSGIQDTAGNVVNGTVDDSWLLDATGPLVSDVLDVTPDPRRDGIDSIDVVFSEAINLSSFTFADLVLSRNSVAVPLDGAVVIEHLADRTYRISGLEAFTSGDGSYQLRVHAAGIQDIAGNAGSGSATDSWFTDGTRPSLVDLVDIAPDPRNSAVTIATVVFSEPIALSTFTFADLALTYEGSPVALTSVVTVSHLSGNSYRISGLDSFNALEGQYELTVIGSGITDVAGNSGVGVVSDSWSIDKTKPSVLDVLDISPDPRTTPVSWVDVTVSEVLNSTSFSYQDLTLTSNGTTVALTNAVSIEHLGATTYRINGLGAFTAISGDYVLTVNGEFLVDVAGNLGNGSASESWKMDTDGPTAIDLVDVSPDPRNTPVVAIDVTLNEPIQLATFTWADLSLTHNGSPVLLSSAVTVSHVTGSTYRIGGLEPFTGDDGDYLLTVTASDIQDLAGNAGAGAVSDGWTMDTSAASLVDLVDIQPDPRSSSVATVDVTFSEPINLASFTSADLSLTRNGTAVGLTPSVTTAFVSGGTYRISGLSSYTSLDGTYELRVVAGGILDLSGNTVLGTVSDAWVKDATGPSLVDLIDVSPDPRNAPVSTVDVVFSEPINLSTFTFANLTLERGIAPIALSSAVTISHVSGNTYRISGLDSFTATPGIYTLRVSSSGIRDLVGNFAVGSVSDSWSVDTAPPVMIDLSDVVPADRNTVVASITVVFSELIDLATFTYEDVELRHNGDLVPLTSAIVISRVSGTTYQIANLGLFASADGDYQITVRGDGIQDSAGNSSSGSLGGSWTLDTVAPTATFSDVIPNPRNASLSSIDVTFSERINAATFTRSDLRLTRNGDPLSLTSVVTITSIGGNAYRIAGLGSYTGTAAEYQLSVTMSGIADPVGNVGAAPAVVNWTMDSTSPVLVDVFDVVPDPRNTALTAVDVVFSEAINLASLTFADLALLRDGAPVVLGPAVSVSHLTGSTYRVSGLESFTSVEGSYQLTVSGAEVTDLANNSGTGQQSVNWTVDLTPPAIEQVIGIDAAVRRTAVNSMDVVFSDVIDAATFTYADISLLRDNLPAPIDSRISVALVSGNTYRISGLESFTDLEGSYILTIEGAGVLDAAGNIGVGVAGVNWILDRTGPTVVDLLDVVPDSRNTAVDAVVVQFSEMIDLSSFSAADLVLLRDNDPITLTAALSIAHESGFNYRIAGLESATDGDGEYELRIQGGEIVDPAGNPGEGLATVTWSMDATPPAAPAMVGIAPDTGLDGDAYTSQGAISIHGLAEAGTTVHLHGEAGILIATVLAWSDGSWTVDLSDQPLPPGDSTFTAFAVDAVGNRSEESAELVVIVDLSPPQVALELGAIDELYGHVTELVLAASEPILGLELDQFRLSRSGVEVPLAGIPLVVTDVRASLPLGNLVKESGDYVLTWTPTSATIDRAGHAVSGVQSFSWAHTPKNPWHNLEQPLDVDRAGSIVPLDALIVINELNHRQFSDATGLLTTALSSPLYRLDVNNDGYVTAIDALLVINHLNSAPLSGEGEHALRPQFGSSASSNEDQEPLGWSACPRIDDSEWLALIANDLSEQLRPKRRSSVL